MAPALRFYLGLGVIYFAFVCFSCPCAAATITAPVTLEKISLYLKNEDPRSVGEFLGALPADMLDNATLIYDSFSLQASTPERPRQILFGIDARFLMGISSVPTDPLYSTVEFASFNPAAGRYENGRIVFDGQTMAKIEMKPAICESCHGERWQPIWGSYTNWPGVYQSTEDSTGNVDTQIDPGMRQAFLRFLLLKAKEPNLAPLNVRIQDNPLAFFSNDRTYPYPNTIFGMVLSGTVAVGAYSRIEAAPLYRLLRWTLLDDVLQCDSATHQAIGSFIEQLYNFRRVIDPTFRKRFGAIASGDPDRLGRYRLLGLDPANEFIKDGLASQASSEVVWRNGFESISAMVEIQVLNDVFRSEPQFRKPFGDFPKRLRPYINLMRLTGVRREKAVATEGKPPLRTEYDWYAFYGELGLQGEYAAHPQEQTFACDLLKKRAQETSSLALVTH